MLKKEYKFIIVLLLIAGIFFYQSIFLLKIPFPGDLLASYNPWKMYSFLGFSPGGIPNKAQYFDTLRQLYPWKQLVIESFRQLQIPLWNPYDFSGAPLLANNQSSAWYPFNLLYFLLSQPIAWTILIVLQPILSSLGTYFFARKLGIGKWGSLFASVAYGYCLFQSVFLEYNTIGHVIALLPWTLFGIELLILKRKILGSILFVFSTSVSFFAGHIQIWGFSMIFIFVYFIFRTFDVKNKVGFAVFIFILFSLSLLISSIQLVPTLELINYSARVPQNYLFLINNLLINPYQLIVLLIPDIFGNPTTRNYLLSDSYPGNAMYIGLIPLIFASYSLFRVTFNRFILFFASASFILLLFLVKTPFTEIFYKLNIPLFSTGSPSNALFLLSFSFALMSGFGLEYFLEKKEKKMLLILVVGVVGFIVLFSLIKLFHLQLSVKNILYSFVLLILGSLAIVSSFFTRKKITLIACAIIFLTIFDLFYFFNKFNPFVDAALVFPNTSIIQELKSIVRNQRIWSYGDSNIEPNVLSMFHLEDPNGYDPLYPKLYGEFISSSYDGEIHTEFTNQSRSDAVIAPAFTKGDLGNNLYRMKILDATSTSYILSKEYLNSDFLLKHNWESIFAKDGWYIYQNKSSLPHAYLAFSYMIYTTPQDFSKKFYSDGFSLDNTVLLNKSVTRLSATNGTAEVISYTSEKVSIKTNTNGVAILVLTDTYFPGWRAFIDGRETSILKANYTFRGVIVPKGKHTVIFAYQPRSFYIGVTLTIMGVLGFIAMIVALRYSKKIYE